MKDEDVRIIVNLFDEICDDIEKVSKKTLLSDYEKLTLAEAKALYAIGREEPKNMKQIAEILGVAVSTPTRTIDRLVEKGLANRTIGVKDRRTLLIELTSEGKKISEEMDEEGLEITRKMLKDLSGEEIETLKDILLKIRDNLK